ncbi:carbohydrate kinase family protein [Amycolatopsis taiwanensis]|uniref:Ribokinase n=1 Tax=Amycolatopsis taiwanensis TaxID=342230 RepID=A0A9W6R5V7_9PSEU|nr:carbohydrate kinase family protein [Amycolatopsis taiwanensis]GLY68035.1 ribokinase [Amycolatopsis taiwanensis]
MSQTPRCVVMGYASLDFKYATETFEGPGRTTLVRRPLHASGARPGAVSYFALGLTGNGVAVDVVSWVGADENGALFVDHHSRAGVGIDGVSATGSRSPAAHMYWPADGEPVVFFDPGDVDQRLTPQQQQLLAAAPAVIIGVGPEPATAAALTAIPDDALVLWAVKCDPRSVPPKLAVALAARADVICHSEAETDFLQQSCGLDLDALVADGTLLVETRGARGAALRRGQEEIVVAASAPIATEDTTGAGDTFAAGLMARLLHRTDPEAAVRAACADAHALLRSRTNEG